MLDLPIKDAMSTKITMAEKSENLNATIQKMAIANIGAVIIVENEKPIGIFTERDLLKRVVAKNITVKKVTIGQVMTPKIISVTPDTKMSEVLKKMYTNAMRHMVIMENDKLIGIFSLRNLLRKLITE